MLFLTLNHSLPSALTHQNCQDLVFRRAQLKSAKFRPLSREQAAAVAAEARRLHAPDDATAQRAHAAAVKGTHFFSALQARTHAWSAALLLPLLECRDTMREWEKKNLPPTNI
jgi:hypothetical protein